MLKFLFQEIGVIGLSKIGLFVEKIYNKILHNDIVIL